jgi:hypothetical protein
VRTLSGRIRQLQAERHDKHIRSVANPRNYSQSKCPQLHRRSPLRRHNPLAAYRVQDPATPAEVTRYDCAA